MYLTITTKTVKGKKYRSAKIVESYWADNTCKHKVLKTLGPVNSDSDEIKFRKLFEEYKNGNDFVMINDISIKNSKNYGVYHTVNKLFEKYEIDSIIKDNLNKGKHKFNVYSIIKALIINRIEKQNSKHKAFDWVQHDYPETIDANLDNFYSSLDVLFK
ncbi:MAG: hypothetical protein K0B07_01490, partial [DPANN group archaeon]|nr:hypothetical protein [DPANN group archaeon]